MELPEQIRRYMSLREPQAEGLAVLDAISGSLDYRSASLATAATVASDKSRGAKPIEFDTEFPSICFALATGVGKTRLMGASMYYLWKSKGYRNFFILAPNITIYDKLRAELNPVHPKYMFVGLSDFPQPEIYDGDNYLRFQPGQMVMGNPATVFIFNISKIFAPRTDTEFKFHRFNEMLGDSFSAILRAMDDLVVLMDESHRYRGPASLAAINHLKPALGLEFTATPKYTKNVIYSFGLAQAIGRYVKIPTVVTRTNLTTSDAKEMEKLKLIDGLARHELKKARLAEYCAIKTLELTKPFVLISTKDTTHAAQVRVILEADTFCAGRYKGKVIEIHSGKTSSESDENVRRLLSVEHSTSTVEVVIHVNMLKEGWDVKNLYTIIPLRASTSEILTEQTIGRGLRLPFGHPTGDSDLDALEIISHDQYTRLIQEAKGSPLFRFKELAAEDFRPVKSVEVTHGFVDLGQVLDRIAERKDILFTHELSDEKRLNAVVQNLVAEEIARRETQAQALAIVTGPTVPMADGTTHGQGVLFTETNLTPESVPFDPEVEAEAMKKRLRSYVAVAIDVPDILMETLSDRELEPFDVQVNIGPLSLVEQRILTHELATGKERMGDKVAVIGVENPRGMLAGMLIDAVEEMDVENDKQTALHLVDSYLAKLGKSGQELSKIVHLYRDAILKDLKNQVENHIQEETKVSIQVRCGFVKFRPYSKSVLEKDGIVHYSQTVPRSDVQRYLYEGFKKTLYPKVPFDSTPEKDFDAILERDPNVIKWIRPPEGNVPIMYRGRTYNPDFIVETKDKKYMIEVKAGRELTPMPNQEVREKALAAIRWCKMASEIKGAKPWEYKLIPDDVIDTTSDLRFLMGLGVPINKI